MINGDKILREKYPDFDEDNRTPNGLDLQIGKVFELSDELLHYGLYKDKKEVPEQIELLPEEDAAGHAGWFLQQLRPYILQVDRPIKIDENCAQVYKPRSTILRSGAALFTAVGDAGFNGHLSFLFVNFMPRPFFIEQGARFSQLLDLEVQGSSLVYDGDYQEK